MNSYFGGTFGLALGATFFVLGVKGLGGVFSIRLRTSSSLGVFVMPQPIRKECDVSLNGLIDLPDHAQWIGQIVSASSTLESLLGHLLAYLSEGSAPVSISMFHAVTSTDGQRAMLMAAAEHKLAGAELEEFRDLMDEFRTRYGERSRIIHNLWGSSPQHPGKAIWCHSKDSSKISSVLASAETEEQYDLLAPESITLWRVCSIYTVKDLEDVWDRLKVYAMRVREFVIKLQNEHPVIAARRARAQAAQAAETEEPIAISEQDEEPLQE